MTLCLPASYFQVEHVKDAYSLCHYTSNNCWVSHGTSSSQENKNIPFTLKFREEPMLNQNIIDPPQWTISSHCFCCHTSSGRARSSSNYTRMVKRKSWDHVPDSLRPVLSTNSKPQDSHEQKIGEPGFQQYLGMIPPKVEVMLSFLGDLRKSSIPVMNMYALILINTCFQTPCKLVEYRTLFYCIHVWQTYIVWVVKIIYSK